MALTCLLVDDNEAFLASATRLLEAQGARVSGAARSLAEAVQLAERHPPDVALVDVELGAESGFDVVERLQALPTPTPAIMISTHAEDELTDLLAESPAIGFLCKSRLGAEEIRRLVTASRRGRRSQPAPGDGRPDPTGAG